MKARFYLSASVIILNVFVFSFLSAEIKTDRSEFVLLQMRSVDLKGTEYFGTRENLGQHLVIDLFGCNPEKIREVAVVQAVMLEAAAAAKATVVAQKFHQFMPTGVSGALILAESHLAIHTWPEVQGYAAIDIFTCGNTDNFAALEVLKKGFGAQGYVVVEIERGKQRANLVDSSKGAVVFRENLDPLKGFKATVAVQELLESVQSPYQKIEMYQTNAFGKMLSIDGIIQLTEYDNAAYHEMIVHVPLQAHKDPRKVLIIGGGDGGALAEVVKYKKIEEIVICDIDSMVAAVAGKYFPTFAAAYDDSRVRALYQDGADLIKKFSDYFDVVIVDGTDFYGNAAALARSDFYQGVSAALKDDGLMVVQAESLYYDRDFIKELYGQIKSIFPQVGYYNTLVPSYPSGSIGFVMGSKKYAPAEKKNKDAKVVKDLQFYSLALHSASFVLPAFLQKMLD
jgi:spermidine synthase